jgi:hypothetical protein
LAVFFLLSLKKRMAVVSQVSLHEKQVSLALFHVQAYFFSYSLAPDSGKSH